MTRKQKLQKLSFNMSESKIDTWFQNGKNKRLAHVLICGILTYENEVNINTCLLAIIDDICQIIDRDKGFPVSGYIKADILDSLFNETSKNRYNITINEIE
jgi:hypothetical protein